MSKKDKYYHFPICLLANLCQCNDRDAFNETLDLIEVWCYANAGRSFVKDHDGEAFLIEDAPESCIGDFALNAQDHPQIAWGAMTIATGIPKIHSYKEAATQLQRARKFADDWEVKHGSHLLCRIRADIFTDARHDPDSISPRDFLALCGLFAIIGNKEYKQISHDRIYYAASGCKSKAVFEQLGRPATLTIKQVRSAIDKLHERKFFAAVTYQRRHKYYSNRRKQTTLRKILLSRYKDDAKSKAEKKRYGAISIDQVIGAKKQKPPPPSHDTSSDTRC